MVRFLKSTYEIFENAKDFDRYLLVERLTALAYIPASICLALGALGTSGVVPYTAAHEWAFFLAAGIYLALANGRDLNHSIRCLFLTTRSPLYQSNMRRRHHQEPTSYSPSANELRSGVSAQMQMGAAIALTIGSLSLLNASVIALINGKSTESELCHRQFAAAFGMMVIGAAANSASSVNIDNGMDTVSNTRMVVSFQHVVASAAFCVGSVLMLPSMKPSQDGINLQSTIVLVSSLVGSVFIVLSAVINYFHTMAMLWYHEDLFEWNMMMNQRNRRDKYIRKEKTPLTYSFEDLGEEDEINDTSERSRRSEEEYEEGEDRYERKKKRQRQRQRQRRSSDGHKYEKVPDDEHEKGVLARLKEAVRQRGARFMWIGTEAATASRDRGTGGSSIVESHSETVDEESGSSATTIYETDTTLGIEESQVELDRHGDQDDEVDSIDLQRDNQPRTLSPK